MSDDKQDIGQLAEAEDTRQYGWVIEVYINSTLNYWCGRDSEDWRVNARAAIRFARWADASIVLAWMLSNKGRAVYHIWPRESI